MRYVLISLVVLAGCEMGAPKETGPVCLDCPLPVEAAPEAATAGAGEVLPAEGEVTATSLDAPAAGAGAEVTATAPAGALGSAVASLGDPTKAGNWVETSLVAAPTKGRITLSSGQSLDVDLLPGTGAPTSARMSIGAYKALGLTLTDLPEITISKL